MFGEYTVYINYKPIILLCENTVYVNKNKKIEDLMSESETAIPYKGAK